ncbi:hypothetical protein [Aliivibrio sifiae]|uniref:hypothetical protein n=1 Tax=Aliivibrio sifiae TaxID=566293 RepID=UPI003D0BEC01
MDIDYNYIKNILEFIKDGQTPYIDSSVVYKKYLDADEESACNFIFHWHLIIENSLISTNTQAIYELKGSGLHPSPQYPMSFSRDEKRLRLTNLGIEFLSSLQEPKILDVIVQRFKHEGFSAVFEVSKQLGMKVINKKLEDINF